MEIKLNDGRIVHYQKQCKHEDLKYLDTINTYDYDGFPIERDIYICLDCGARFEK